MPSARGGATMITALASPDVTAASRRPARSSRNARSDCSCQSVCSMALRVASMELKARPGASLPCSRVLRSLCSYTSLVLRLGNLPSPIFSSSRAFLPSQTTTQSFSSIFSLAMAETSLPILCAGSRAGALIGINARTAIQLLAASVAAVRQLAPSVAAVQQAPGDHLRLDLGGALEDRQDAGVAQQARHRVFERKTIAAVDLHGIVGRRPRHARRQQLGHAGFEIAAPSRILLARRMIGDLARNHDLDRHHGDLVGDSRKPDERTAELLAFLGVAQGDLHRRLGDA